MSAVSMPYPAHETRELAIAGSSASIKALIFDVDGTLYHQSSLRRAMIRKLFLAYWNAPAEGLRVMRSLRHYRKAQEELRGEATTGRDLNDAQLKRAEENSGSAAAAIQQCIERWMYREPLTELLQHRREGLLKLLIAAKQSGLGVAAVSDYPAVEKLTALGVEEYFDAVISAQDEDVQAFKPSSRGLQVALARLRVKPEEAIYIGDRYETDAEAALAIGMKPVLIGNASRSGNCMNIGGFDELMSALRESRSFA